MSDLWTPIQKVRKVGIINHAHLHWMCAFEKV